MTVGELKKILDDFDDDKLVVDLDEDEIIDYDEDSEGNLQLFVQ